MLRPCLALITVFLLLAGSSAIAGDSVVIYRCTDGSGALTVQNDVPCPKGHRQERRVIEAALPASMPSSVPPSAPPEAPMQAPPAPTVEPARAAVLPAAGRLPPPVLFECRTHDDGRYLSDDGAPPERCVPLQTTGIGGVAGVGAGTACEMVADQCQRIADEALCEGWHQRLRQAESALRFGRFESREAAQAEVDRVARITRESTCGI